MTMRKEICKIVSEMLDNPDKCGIYPTTKCYNELVKLLNNKQKITFRLNKDLDNASVDAIIDMSNVTCPGGKVSGGQGF